MNPIDPKDKPYSSERKERNSGSFNREDSSSANNNNVIQFGKDKRKRTTTTQTEKVERIRKPFSEGDKPEEQRRSFNPNFTKDNKLVGSGSPFNNDRREPRERNNDGFNSDTRSFNNRENKPYSERKTNDRAPYGSRSDKPAYSANRTNFADKDRNRSSFNTNKDFNRDSANSERNYNSDKAYNSHHEHLEERRSYGNRDSRPSFNSDRDFNRNSEPRKDRPTYENRGSKPSFNTNRDFNRHDPRGTKPAYGGGERKPYGENKPSYGGGERKPYGENKRFSDKGFDPNRRSDERRPYPGSRPSTYNKKKEEYPRFEAPKIDEPIRLNKYIAASGLCSRREADDYITSGVVAVNDVIITELGTKIEPTDIVKVNNAVIQGEKKVYILMNKPKGFVTSLDDPHADKTVMDIVKNACQERIYPVGRLDKNSVGVLLLTNDGDLTKQLTHPSFSKKKVYQVMLDKALTKADIETIAEGVTLEDGKIVVDDIAYLDAGRKDIGIEIHSGRNRIVRRIFESLGYKVVKLDRVYFAGLTKKTLKRGAWRFLTPKEVGILKSGEYQ